MTTSFEDLYDSLLDENTIKDFPADIMTSVANTATNFVDAIGGGGNTLLTFGSIATRVFSKNIAQSLAITISNLQAVKNNAKQVQAEFETLEMFKGIEVADIKQLVNMKKEVLNFNSIMTEGQHEQANNLIKLTNDLNNQQLAWEENVQQAEEYIEKFLELKI